MAEFILVPGAWLGAWAWDDVARELRAAGHGAHPLTLSGLADRQESPVGRRAHVRDIVDEAERLAPRDVVLVGHSYAGIPVGQAAGLLGDRVAHVVFVDANVPVDGESFASCWWQGQQVFEATLAENGGVWPPLEAAGFDGQGLSSEQVARLANGATPHPGTTLTEPAELARPLGDLPATYIKCLLDGEEPMDDAAEALKSDLWHLVEMDTGHWPMFSRPRELARILHASARA
ncbi:Alpha/beta fold hydrolase OS=Streptomyces alboniger OX=132473 GN=CP975_24890 PE=4 SV=1 [Streptomyces alboniger]